LLGSSQSSSDCFSGVVFNNLNNCTIHINYEGKPEIKMAQIVENKETRPILQYRSWHYSGLPS